MNGCELCNVALLFIIQFFQLVSAGSSCGAKRVTVSHGARHGRRSASAGFSVCRGPAALSNPCPPQTRSGSAGCRGGHHRGQLWTGERLAFCWFFFFFLFNLDVDALYKSHHTDKQTFPSSWVVVTCLVVMQVRHSHHEQGVCYLCCRVCTGLPRRRGSPGAVWTRCSPSAAGGRGADSELNRFTAAGAYAAEIYPLEIQ